MAPTWQDEDKVDEYVGRVGRLAARAAGEAELVEALPARVERVLDLGCGDGRLIDVVLGARSEVVEATGVDNSPPMLDRARARFEGDPRVTIDAHDLRYPLPTPGSTPRSAPEPTPEAVDAIVSGFAIHHLPHDRKRTLFGEVAHALAPGGVFVNLEVVRCATPELQEEFHRRIDKPGGDPEDILAGVDEQLGWMRDAGLTQVDCYWRWRGFALLVGAAPVPVPAPG